MTTPKAHPLGWGVPAAVVNERAAKNAAAERDHLKTEVTRLREANEHWHTRASHHATDMDAALAERDTLQHDLGKSRCDAAEKLVRIGELGSERDRLKKLCDELTEALELIDAAFRLAPKSTPANLRRAITYTGFEALRKAKESAQ